MSKTKQRRQAAYNEGYRDGQAGVRPKRRHKLPGFYRRGYNRAIREERLKRPKHLSFDDDYLD